MMGTEIERKFLVDNSKLEFKGKGEHLKQGYLFSGNNTVTRIRVAGEAAFLTIKGENKGATRLEFEYSIPLDDANEILNLLCIPPVIEKIRHRIDSAGHIWEVDVFKGENEGLIVAEVELSSETERVDHPEWVGTEVTNDPKYYNSNLQQHPYKKWGNDK